MNVHFYLALVCFAASTWGYAQVNPSDGCTGVPALTVNTTCVNNSYSLSGSYSNGGLVSASCFSGNNRDDGWYSFTATGTTTNIELTGDRDHVLAVFSTCGGGTELACDFATSGNTASVSFATTIGTTYFIQVHRTSGNNTATMDGNICVYEPAITPTDCAIGEQVCTTTTLPGNSAGFGTQELNATNQGCLLGNEHQSSWYLVSIGTAGTFQLTIAPNVATDDYDFAVWGPNSTCPPNATPIRCSYSATTGNTGISTALNGAESPQTSEGSGGNKYVDDLSVLAGEVYLICIDNFSSTSTSFNLSFGGTSGISCVPLPVQMVEYDVQSIKGVNSIEWTTKSEINNDFFTLERSFDGEFWQPFATIDGAGNSTSFNTYSVNDYLVYDGWTYYQLWQTDFDGATKNLGIISVDNQTQEVTLVKIVNLLGEEVQEDYDGIKVYIYSDGSTVKRVSTSN